MSKAEPTIQKYMTYQPVFIEDHSTIEDAFRTMNEFDIRHLPIMNNERVVGVISDRDLKMISGILGFDPRTTLVKDVASEDLYQVGPEAPLAEVARQMAELHVGAAVVIQNGKLVGIFTTMDACEALASVLSQRHHS